MAISTPAETRTVTLTIDGRETTVPEGTTIWDAAKDRGIEIPVLCHDPRYDPVGVCRMCVVDVGGRVLAAACMRPCEDGMKVETATDKVERQRRMLTRLLLADQPPPGDPKETTTGDSELQALVRPLRGQPGRCRAGPGAVRTSPTRSSPSITRPASSATAASAPATRSSRNEVIGRTGKGHATRIGFDLDEPMGESTCVSCGECAASCPTGALTQQAAHAAAACRARRRRRSTASAPTAASAAR